MKSQSSDHPVTEKSDPVKKEPEMNALDDPATDASDVDEIVTLARRYYATSFPNPQRYGCPPPGEILRVVSRRRVPDHALREHLFECSECFGEYRQALAQCRNEVVEWKRLAAILTLRRVSTSGGVLLLLAFVGIMMWRKPEPDARNEQITRSNPSSGQMAAPSASPNKTDIPVTGGSLIAEVAKPPVKPREVGGRSRSSGRPEPGVETINVDLDNYQVYRRSQEEKQPVVLPAIRASLVLRLPETGAAGKYTVSLINAFGGVLLSEPAVSPDGAKLQVMFDLRRITPKKYRLRLSRKGEAPAYYEVIIRRR